jgi:hypothetical protein
MPSSLSVSKPFFHFSLSGKMKSHGAEEKMEDVRSAIIISRRYNEQNKNSRAHIGDTPFRRLLTTFSS